MDSKQAAPGGGAQRTPGQQTQHAPTQGQQAGAWAAFGTGGGAAIVFRDLASI